MYGTHFHCVSVLPLQSMAVTDIPPIMSALFECTVDMINKNLEEFPDHRTNFFKMLQSVTVHCFTGKPCGVAIFVLVCL